MSTITVRTTAPADKYLSANKNKSATISRCIENWATCERQAMLSLKGRFTSAELCSFIDMLNGTIISASQASTMRFEFSDACTLDGLDKKWKIDKVQTLEAMTGLSAAEYIVLVEWCRAFWDNPDCDLEEYTKTMAKKTFRTQDRETGNPIEEFSTLADAKTAIEKYEKDDKEEDNYTPNFYEIAEFNPETENWEAVYSPLVK